MDNDELLIKIKDMFDTKVDEVKRHMEVITENLESKVQIVAEGHHILNRKLDEVKQEVKGLKSDMAMVKDDVKGLKSDMAMVKDDVKGLKSDMAMVKDYVIGVDAKLNEHEIILKRVK